MDRALASLLTDFWTAGAPPRFERPLLRSKKVSCAPEFRAFVRADLTRLQMRLG
jgi:hypothetical protein